MLIASCIGVCCFAWGLGIGLLYKTFNKETRYESAPSASITLSTEVEGLI